MILTCPECATSYFVEDLRIPPGGRMVKCTTCGARWRATQDEGDAPSEITDDDLVVEAPAEVAAADDLEFVPAPVKPARKAQSKQPRRNGLFVGVGAAAVLVVAVGAVVLLRQQIFGMVPASAPLFAAVGLPVDTLGLVIENLKSKATFQAGRPVLSVTGVVRNVRDETAVAPPLHISLLDKTGKPVASMVAEVTNARVPPGAKRYFAIALPNPPAGSHELEVTFERAAEGAAQAPAAHAPADAHVDAAAHAAAPVEAQALPADSPDALTKHE